MYLFYLGIAAASQLFWLSWRGKEDSWLINRSHAAPFFLASLAMIVGVYAIWFSARIYPLIPSSLGGGRPLTIVFIEAEKKFPEEIKKPDPSARRSIPYRLLLLTDKYYVVVAPNPNERSLEISRESVAGMVVLE